MKQVYRLRPFILLIICMAGFLADAQGPVEYINANMVNAGIGIGGNLFTKLDTLPTQRNGLPITDTTDLYDLYEVPQGTNKRDVFTASLWMNGMDSNGTLHCAAQAYNANGPDFYNGPIAAAYDSFYLNYYNRVFKVTKAVINSDMALSFPASPSAIDSSILLWPGAGNPYVASTFGVDIATGLAPFVDVDHDGIYDPMKGDYPAICGDEAIFFVFNDVRGPHYTTGTAEKLGVEMRGMAYEFTDSVSTNFVYPKRAINNTVFVQYDIENKSSLNYDSFYIALFEDPDIGCYSNDRVGCDTVRNMMFAYNGTTPDPDCQTETGNFPYQTALGVTMLNQTMNNFFFYTNNISFDTGCEYYYNAARATVLDSPYHIGGHYEFPGDPNDTSQWSEESVANILPPGDRKDYGTIGPVNFNAGEIIHFDLAFTTSYDSTATLLGIVDTLKRDADIVQAFYNNTVIPCRNAQDTLLGIRNVGSSALFQLTVFPNPASSNVIIEAGSAIQSLQITDITGRTVIQQTCNQTRRVVDISILAKGIYLLRITNGDRLAVKKIVVE